MPLPFCGQRDTLRDSLPLTEDRGAPLPYVSYVTT